MYAGAMFRLRRLVLSDRFFFLAVKLPPKRVPSTRRSSRCWRDVSALFAQRANFQLTAWVLLPGR